MAQIRWLGVVRALLVAVGVLLNSPLFAQENVCQAPADKALFACLRQLAEYTSWMVVPNNSVAPGKLHQAIDDAVKDLGSLVICITRVFSRISLIFKRIVNIPRGQAGYVGTGDLDSQYRSSVA